MPGPIDDGSKGAPTGVAAIKDLVETANAEDEKTKNDGDDDAGDNADDNGDSNDDSDEEEIDDEDEGDDAGDAGDNPDDKRGDDSQDSDDDADDDSKTTRRFTQFAGDGKTETYISNLEKGYQNSSAEAIRLKSEKDQATSRVDAVMKIVAGDAELAAKVNAAMNGAGGDAGGDSNSDAKGAHNPFVSDLQARWNEKSDAEIEKFIEANPEVISDPKIAEDVKHYMKVLSEDHLKRTGKLMTGGEAMEAAYRTLGLENKLTKQNLAQGAKKTAAPTRPQGPKKKAPATSKKTFTSDQLEMARKMGKADPQAWLEKNAQ